MTGIDQNRLKWAGLVSNVLEETGIKWDRLEYAGISLNRL